MLFVLALLLGAGTLFAQEPVTDAATESDKEEALAKKLANPIANLISVPLQYNYDQNMGPNDDGSVSRLNIQPVIPFILNEKWNLITRTIIPVIVQQDIPVMGSKSGLGDITASQFFSPKKPMSGGWIWGAGPVELLSTATDEALGREKLGLGPTAVILKQTGPWTVGGMANHIWSVAGDSNRSDISATFLQPFASYITEKTKTTLMLTSESTYDWKNEAWAIPVNVTVLQLLKVGPQIIQIGVGARYWLDSPKNGPEGWGFRAQLTFLIPK